MIPLFEKFPLLSDRLPYVSLGQFPTPVQRLDEMGKKIGVSNLYIKRDDLSGQPYGGNKPRKLEFLLGAVLSANKKEVITFGAAGSNHALATAIYARQVGLKSIFMLMSQPGAHYVCRNLLAGRAFGAELHPCGKEVDSLLNTPLVFMATIYQLLRHRLMTGYFPAVIAPGGSSPLGVIGFVNAAFELKQQIDNKELPEPDCVYVASGTMGTAAGLILGLKAANLRTRVIPVQVTSEKFVNTKGMMRLIRKTNSLLHSLDPSFPIVELSEKDINIECGFFGQKYALFTPEGVDACLLMNESEGICLDGTYTGKTMAALIDSARKKLLRDKVVLFWNTLNSGGISLEPSVADYKTLPEAFHCYFEEKVQPLDRQQGELFQNQRNGF